MVESRWFRRAGPAVAALGGIVLIATTTLGSPGRAWTPEACAGAPRIGASAPGTWYRIDPVLDAGTRTGQRVVIGRAGERATRALDLDAESFAAGPFGGATLVGTDDGRHSRLSLVDAAGACAWPLVASRDVIRTATLASDGTSLFEFRVDRQTRADLGVWRRALDGSTAPARVLAPIAADGRFGPTWTTDLVWSEDGQTLAVQSCGEIACRVRIVDPRRRRRAASRRSGACRPRRARRGTARCARRVPRTPLSTPRRGHRDRSHPCARPSRRPGRAEP